MHQPTHQAFALHSEAAGSHRYRLLGGRSDPVVWLLHCHIVVFGFLEAHQQKERVSLQSLAVEERSHMCFIMHEDNT